MPSPRSHPGSPLLAVSLALAALTQVGGCAAPAAEVQPTAAAAQPATPVESVTVAGLSSEARGWLDRLTWGANAGSALAWQKEGRERFVAAQLHPAPAPLPADVEATIASYAPREPLERLVMRLEAERKAARAMSDADAREQAQKSYQAELGAVARASAVRSLLIAVYSPNQLESEMTWFWLNHFSVCQCKRDLRAMVGDYEERAIRPHALGKFRDLLVATMRHPAMLRYLDNEQNAAGRINENYARELMELHTLGVDGGYAQQDVQELARVLTGLGINATERAPRVRPARAGDYWRDGLAEFNPNRHDYGDKVLLGRTIHGGGLAEIDRVAAMLAAHPSTAHFVSRKLAQYFVADDPPPALVERMARTFLDSDGDIAKVLDAMFRAPEFRSSLHAKFKDPVRYVVSAVRIAYDDRPIGDPTAMLGWLARMGEPMYGRPTPDGYPLTQSGWTSPAQLVARFEVARLIGARAAALPSRAGAETALGHRVEVASLERLDPATREALDQARSAREWNALFLSSPEFMQY